MEGVGSRLGRASSRYGPTATVFNGPVRKWKKKWVHVPSSSSSSTVSSSNKTSSHHSQSNGSHRLLLRRWTPVPTTVSIAGTATDADESSDEQPKRKFRYTPIAVVEEQKRGAVAGKKFEAEEESNQYTARRMAVSDMNEAFEEEIEELHLKKASSEDADFSPLDLGLYLNKQESY